MEISHFDQSVNQSLPRLWLKHQIKSPSGKPHPNTAQRHPNGYSTGNVQSPWNLAMLEHDLSNSMHIADMLLMHDLSPFNSKQLTRRVLPFTFLAHLVFVLVVQWRAWAPITTCHSSNKRRSLHNRRLNSLASSNKMLAILGQVNINRNDFHCNST